MLRVFVIAANVLCTVALTKQEVGVIAPKIRTLVQNQRPLLGTIVRLAFHDCAGQDGCDGCIGEQLTENAGLTVAITALEQIYTTLAAPKPSRADFWALSGIVAAGFAIERSGVAATAVPSELQVANFWWGRQDCRTSPHSVNDTATNFPSSNLGNAGVLNYFGSWFGFTQQQTVAIMGAHNLGRAHTQASGFNGGWKGANDVLDGGYYASLQTPAWVQFAYTPNHLQWIRPPPPGTPFPPPAGAPPPQATPMLLNADTALVKDITINAANGAVACRFGQCPVATKTVNQVAAYANPVNKLTFQKDFAKAFFAMQNVCGRSGSSITACSVAPVA